MPKREDDYWADHRQEAGHALCPFCGSLDVCYNNYFKSWRCSRCEKSFSSPSYGTGDMTRWGRPQRPKSPSEMTPQEWREELIRTGAIREVEIKDQKKVVTKRKGKSSMNSIFPSVNFNKISWQGAMVLMIILVIIIVVVYLTLFADITS